MPGQLSLSGSVPLYRQKLSGLPKILKDKRVKL
jgi:hypothetical protein